MFQSIHSYQPITADILVGNNITTTSNEPNHTKTNKMNCAPSEDSDQAEHPFSLISLHCPHKEALGLCSYSR